VADAASHDVLLSVGHLSKSFPGVRALADVDFDLHAGEVHALVGENGAGKSTFVKVLGGGVVPQEGDVRLDGVALPFGDPLAARRRCIDIIYQEFTLVPQLTAAENIFLGRERGRMLLRRAEMRREAQALLDRLGAAVDADAPVASLGVAQQQMVEIARALAGDRRVLVLDEPTAALSERETARLFDILRDLRASGLGIIYISHRLSEIFAIADRVTVLRDGRRVATAPVEGLDRAQLIRWMVGRDLADEFPPRAAAPRDVLLEVRHLAASPYFFDVSLTVRRGEIVGLAGLVGAGRTSFGLALYGALRSTGDVRLAGAPYRPARPRDATTAGVAYVTEDRAGAGIFPLLTACANVTVTELGRFARLGVVVRARETSAAGAAAASVGFRGRLDHRAGALSGGNQQKLLVARDLINPPQLLVLDEPTRGIDVGAKREIYDVMNTLTAQGMGILMISSELPEILGMSDRIVVMREGRTTGELSRNEATAEAVMHLATLDHAVN
jgi:ABC-type sugar transport system ATPase subunit